ELAEIYRKMMMVKGHHHKQALCAVANRLANRIYSVLKHGRPYVLRDIDGSPVTVAQGKTIILKRSLVPESIRASRRANRP
ncbi:IS110 family transposase, partial [Acetobacter senegalensis]|nr:IS110 family transposase [Acetobacter senegalensis]